MTISHANNTNIKRPLPRDLHPECAVFEVKPGVWVAQSATDPDKGFTLTSDEAGNVTSCNCGALACWPRRRVALALRDVREAAQRKQSEAERERRLRAPLNPNVGFSLMR